MGSKESWAFAQKAQLDGDLSRQMLLNALFFIYALFISGLSSLNFHSIIFQMQTL